MTTDIASSYFADELGLDMNNSPVTPTMDINDQFSGMMKNFYSPDTYAEDAASYDYFSFDDSAFAMKAAPNNDFMSWTTNAGIANQAAYAAPLPPSSFGSYFGSPETEYLNDGFVSPAALGPDTDSESTSSGRKHSMEEQPAMMGSMSPPPTKKQCSTKAKTSSTSSKSKPKDSKARSGKSGSAKSPPTGPASVASSASSHGGNHNIQLRTASRKPKPTTSQENRSTTGSVEEEYEEDDDALTNEERRARRNHNNVEKQYRNRLNQQFEKLLAVLPAADQRAAQGGGKSGGGGAGKSGKGDGGAASADGDDKRMSKAEVLDLARRRIQELEDQRASLQHERNGLLENVGRMQQQVMRQRMELAGRA